METDRTRTPTKSSSSKKKSTTKKGKVTKKTGGQTKKRSSKTTTIKKKSGGPPKASPIEVSIMDVITTPAKRKIHLYTLDNKAPQGEVDIQKIKKFVIEAEEFTRRRPSLQQGWWKLNTGDWARREGARFLKDENTGQWVEVKLVSEDVDYSELMGTQPLKRAAEELRSQAPIDITDNTE